MTIEHGANDILFTVPRFIHPEDTGLQTVRFRPFEVPLRRLDGETVETYTKEIFVNVDNPVLQVGEDELTTEGMDTLLNSYRAMVADRSGIDVNVALGTHYETARILETIVPQVDLTRLDKYSLITKAGNRTPEDPDTFDLTRYVVPPAAPGTKSGLNWVSGSEVFYNVDPRKISHATDRLYGIVPVITPSGK